MSCSSSTSHHAPCSSHAPPPSPAAGSGSPAGRGGRGAPIGRHVEISDTRLHVVERGGDGLPLLILHGGPALDHHMFGDYLDPLGDELPPRARRPAQPGAARPRARRDVDARADGRRRRRAGRGDGLRPLRDARALLRRLRRAPAGGRRPGHAAATIVSSGVPSARYLAAVEANLAAFEPVELREQVTQSWAREQDAQTAGGVRRAPARPAAVPLRRPARPADRRVRAPDRRAASTRPTSCATSPPPTTAAIEVEDRLGDVTQPVLVLAGRHDRTCVVEAGEAIAAGIPRRRARGLRAERPHDLRRGERGLPRRRAALPSVGAVEAVAGVPEARAGCSPARRAARRSPRRRSAPRGARRGSPRAPRAPRPGRRSAAARRPRSLRSRSALAALPPVASIGSTSTISASGPWSGIDS